MAVTVENFEDFCSFSIREYGRRILRYFYSYLFSVKTGTTQSLSGCFHMGK